jgi:hypothetical protein
LRMVNEVSIYSMSGMPHMLHDAHVRSQRAHPRLARRERSYPSWSTKGSSSVMGWTLGQGRGEREGEEELVLLLLLSADILRDSLFLSRRCVVSRSDHAARRRA